MNLHDNLKPFKLVGVIVCVPRNIPKHIQLTVKQGGSPGRTRSADRHLKTHPGPLRIASCAVCDFSQPKYNVRNCLIAVMAVESIKLETCAKLKFHLFHITSSEFNAYQMRVKLFFFSIRLS